MFLKIFPKFLNFSKKAVTISETFSPVVNFSLISQKMAELSVFFIFQHTGYIIGTTKILMHVLACSKSLTRKQMVTGIIGFLSSNCI